MVASAWCRPANRRLVRALSRPGWRAVGLEPAGGRRSRAERRGVLDVGPVRSGRHRLVARSVGSLTIESARGGFRVALDDPEATATLRLHRPAGSRGVRLADKPRPAGGTREDGMSWAAPVATSVLAGSVSIRGAPRNVTGWRASYEHGWGGIDLSGASWVARIDSSCTAPEALHGCSTDSTDATPSTRQAAGQAVDQRPRPRERARCARMPCACRAQRLVADRAAGDLGAGACSALREAAAGGSRRPSVYNKWDSHDRSASSPGPWPPCGGGVHLRLEASRRRVSARVARSTRHRRARPGHRGTPSRAFCMPEEGLEPPTRGL